MIIEEIMNKEIYSLLPSNTVKDAIQLMREKNIRHLPIVDEQNKVIGLVTEHDIKNIVSSNPNEDSTLPNNQTLLEKIMVKDPIVGHPLDFIEEVALTFYESKISCLPIVSGGKLVGIVTTTDLLYSYIELTGAHKPSSKIDIRATDKPGIMSNILATFKLHKVNVLSILVYPDSETENSRIISIRAQILNPLSIINDLRNEGFEVLWPHLPGVHQ